MDRDSRILYAGLCCGCTCSDSGLGNHSSAGQELRYGSNRVHTHGNITTHSSVIARFDSWGQVRLEILSHAASIFSSGDIVLHLHLRTKNEKQEVKMKFGDIRQQTQIIYVLHDSLSIDSNQRIIFLSDLPER